MPEHDSLAILAVALAIALLGLGFTMSGWVGVAYTLVLLIWVVNAVLLLQEFQS